MDGKTMRGDDLTRALFDEECDAEIAALARAAIGRMDETYPGWLDNLATPPRTPTALLDSVLAAPVPGVNPHRRRWRWVWRGALSAAAATVAVVLLLPQAAPPPQEKIATGPASQTLALPALPPGPVRLTPTSDRFAEAPLPAAPVFVKTIPSVRQALEAHAERPTDATRAALLRAMADGGLTLREGDLVTRIDIAPALATRLNRPLPPLLKVRRDGPGWLAVSE